MCREKTCKEIFYRGDMDTLFDRYGSLRKAIAQSAKALKEDMASGQVDPLQEAKDPFGDADVASRGLAAKYALQHFQDLLLFYFMCNVSLHVLFFSVCQETCDEDALYTLPTEVTNESLASVFSGADLHQEDPFGSDLVDDTPCIEQTRSTEYDCSVTVFRVLNFNVAGQKVLPTVLQRTRGDHIAIANYKIEARELPL